jgi:hypothetical protein
LKRIRRNGHSFWSAQCFEVLRRLLDSGIEAADAETGERSFHMIDDTRALTDEPLTLAARTLAILIRQRWDRHHPAVSRSPAQLAQEHTHQHRAIKPVRFGALSLARHRNTRRMDHVHLDAAHH